MSSFSITTFKTSTKITLIEFETAFQKTHFFYIVNSLRFEKSIDRKSSFKEELNSSNPFLTPIKSSNELTESFNKIGINIYLFKILLHLLLLLLMMI